MTERCDALTNAGVQCRRAARDGPHCAQHAALAEVGSAADRAAYLDRHSMQRSIVDWDGAHPAANPWEALSAHLSVILADAAASGVQLPPSL